MKISTLSLVTPPLWLRPTNGIRRSPVINRLEPEMTYLSTHSMMTMQYLPVYDRKLVAYGLAWVAIVVTSMIALARYV